MNIDKIISGSQAAKRALAKSDAAQRHQALQQLHDNLQKDRAKILAANKQDVEAADSSDADAFIDRLILNDQRFDGMLESVKSVLDLPDILGEIYGGTGRQPSGIEPVKMRVPLGTILMIYESRPNVTTDAAALAIKTGNIIILKGGHEVQYTNAALAETITEALQTAGLPPGAVTVLTSQSREVTQELLKRDDAIDLVIPRGSRKLLEYIQASTNIPTLLHLEGNCHVYIDAAADKEMAIKLTVDAKTQRYGTCNTAESVLIHQDVAKEILPPLAEQLTAKGVEIRGDAATRHLVKQAIPATDDDWSEEYLGPVVSVKVVGSLDEAIEHINAHGSGHTDAIVTDDQAAADKFLHEVDSASVMHNTSTRLADGYEYGLGAEIGISTGRLHARGPVGQEGLTTYKWIVKSDGVTKSGILKA